MIDYHDLYMRFAKAMDSKGSDLVDSCSVEDWFPTISGPDAHFLMLSVIYNVMDNGGSFTDAVTSWKDFEGRIIAALDYFGMSVARDLVSEAIEVGTKIEEAEEESLELSTLEQRRNAIDDEEDIAVQKLMENVLSDPARFFVDIREFV